VAFSGEVGVSEPFPQMKLDAWQVYSDAIVEHQPRKVFCLYSGGNDSTVLLHWAKQGRLDAAVHVDTGTALPGVREYVEHTCEQFEVPLLVYEAGDAFERLVLDPFGPTGKPLGFPGPSAHRFAYTRLKERQIEALVRDHKEQRSDRIMLLTGKRRHESARRSRTSIPVERRKATVWVNPLIDWTNEDMRAYRAAHQLPESDVAALVHMSGECTCGSFATKGERKMLASLFPEWDERISDLERRAESADATNCKWGSAPPEAPTDEAPMCSDCQLRLEPPDSDRIPYGGLMGDREVA
jgi:3'-phosphoadenosine 5'-phosphosulfate sulfotransferase (PAPS reductase)/FAD synthetase